MNNLTNRELYLLTECTEWQSCSHGGCKARREIERLTRERDRLLATIGEHVTVRSDQYAEIQRLRAALESIRRLSHEVDADAWRSMALNLVGEVLCGDGQPNETATEPVPTAVRLTFDAGRMVPVLEWTRMPSGAYVVLAGTPDNFDSLWFDREGHHPKSELVFAQLIPQPSPEATEAMMARARSAQKASEVQK